MAFDATNLKLVDPIGRIWVYNSPGDAAATVIAGTYILDGYGLDVGDTVIVREFTSSALTSLTTQSFHAVTTVATTGVTLSSAQTSSSADDVVLSAFEAAVSSAVSTVRLLAPFAGEITAVRAVVNGSVGGTAKVFALTISGTAVTSGTVTIAKTAIGGTKYVASITTGNTIAAGQEIKLTGTGVMTGSKTANFFVVCRR